jgi:hypothetical protein
MLDSSFMHITEAEVRDLANVSLNIAYALHVEKWAWYEKPNEGYPLILLDEAPIKPLNEDIGIYLGDDRYVYSGLPKFNEDLYRTMEMGRFIIASGFGREYMVYLEEEVNSSNHARLSHAGADKRCRAILRFFLANPGKMKYKEPSEEKSAEEKA